MIKLNIHIIIAVIVLIKSTSAYTQILLIKPVKQNKQYELESYQYFNEQFIKRNKIKCVEVKYSYKNDNKPIVETKNNEKFCFNLQGNLSSQTKINHIESGNLLDTSIYVLYYDSTIITKVVKSGKNDSYIYDYAKINDNTIQLNYFRVLNDSSRNLLIYSEYIQTEESNNHKIIYTKNDLGKTYKQEIFEYDENNQLINYNDILTYNNTGYGYKYIYDQYGRIIHITKYEIPTSKTLEEIKFIYDSINLMSEEVYINDVLVLKKEFLYSKEMLLQAMLIKDEKTFSIKIYKFNYSFF